MREARDPRKVIAGRFARPLIEAQGLSLTRSGTRLVDGVSIAMAEGRRTVILGANGAGKSLLLRLLHGLMEPDAGTLYWEGRPMRPRDREAQALVFQKPVLLRRSVSANLHFALKVRGAARRERNRLVDEALDISRLSHLAHRPARVLSGGEQQRLAIARALICKPRLLLLDEPTASLDPASTERIETQVAEAHARGVTVVMVTHDTGQARRMADDIVFLHAGAVAERGPAARVLSDPASEPARAWLEGRIFTGPAIREQE